MPAIVREMASVYLLHAVYGIVYAACMISIGERDSLTGNGGAGCLGKRFPFRGGWGGLCGSIPHFDPNYISKNRGIKFFGNCRVKL